jgi:predicted secreted hydrolase
MRLLGEWNWWLPVRLKRLVGAGITAVLAVALFAGCAGTPPILANPPVVRPAPPATPTPAPRPADPQPVTFPRDDAPHDRLTEWWYYTGHLRSAEGQRFGFEFVIFRAERGEFPVSWASHLALTDETGNRFLYAQRSEIGAQVDTSPRGVTGEPVGFELSVHGDADSPGAGPDGWSIAGSTGSDRLRAFAPEFGLALTLASERPPVLHDAIGWIDFGPAGSSYYYSRPRMAVAGDVTLGDVSFKVEGSAWFDHQWGDFISVGAGGWDWFAVNLADGTDLTLSVIRDRDDLRLAAYGTLVRPDGSIQHLESGTFTIESGATWTSPHTGAVYPAAWRIEVPGEGLTIELAPTVPDQELDTRPTTGVVYWEGSQVVRATRNGEPLEGEAYVELTGYEVAPGR